MRSDARRNEACSVMTRRFSVIRPPGRNVYRDAAPLRGRGREALVLISRVDSIPLQTKDYENMNSLVGPHEMQTLSSERHNKRETCLWYPETSRIRVYKKKKGLTFISRYAGAYSCIRESQRLISARDIPISQMSTTYFPGPRSLALLSYALPPLTQTSKAPTLLSCYKPKETTLAPNHPLHDISPRHMALPLSYG